MKAKLSILALGAMALVSSCSNDQTVDINDGNAIKFGVTAGKSSRAAVSDLAALQHPTTGGFKVWAIDDANNKYIDGAAVNYSSGAWTMGVKKFWPQSQLSFFAVYPAGAVATPTLSKTSMSFDYIVSDGATDILYAAQLEKGRPTTASGGTVNLDFNHALSQIVFKVKNNSSDIKVVVKGIEINNVANKGNFACTQTTIPNGSIIPAEGVSKAGVWTITENSLANYTAWQATAEDPAYNVTDKASDFSKIANLFLMPQTLIPWYNTSTSTWTAQGARVLVDCVIKDSANDQVWPKTGDSGKVAISLPGTWNPGYKYTYTIVFGEGAGYDPSTPDNPKPVLVPISFNVQVDGFTDGTSGTLDGATN